MKSLLKSLLLLHAIFSLAACGGGAADGGRDAASEPRPTAQSQASPIAQPAPGKNLPKIVAFGDSLTAGLGLSASQSYPSLLQKRLEADGFQYEVVNAGVSGDTSAGGLRRIDWALEGDVRFLILELGANDLLRGQPVGEMKKNLGQIIERARERNVEVLLAGMYAPTNTGPEYQRESFEAFQSLAREYEVEMIPFFLERVAGVETLNQADGVHPNAEGTRVVAETVYQKLRPMLEKQKRRAE